MLPGKVGYDAVIEAMRLKFGFRGIVKLKIRDEEGDMVTLGDEEDLRLVLMTCKAVAAQEKSDLGKMEMWVSEVI